MSAPLDRLRVALVDDDPSIRKIVAPLLGRYDIDAEAFDRVPVARCIDGPDVVVLDLDLRNTGGTDELTTVEAARRCWPMVPIVVWTGRSDPRELARWIAGGAIDSFVLKGDTKAEDLACAIWQAHGRQEGRTPVHAVDDLVALFSEGET